MLANLIKGGHPRDNKPMSKTAEKPPKLAYPKEQAYEWQVAKQPVLYPAAIQTMESRVAAIEAGKASNLLWLVEHPPLYTAGTSAADNELLAAQFPVFQTGRGGRFTYHGPGQRVIYAVIDLRKRGRDVRAHVCRLEDWVIRVLNDFGVKGERRDGRIGIWVNNKGHEEKIAAIGVRVRRWIAYHGLSFNVNPDLAHYQGIVPCGLPEFGITSLKALGVNATIETVDQKFRQHAAELFG
jgi:lipoyl(octanoyl) transferase